MPGAGKSTCVDYLTSKNIPNIYFGGIVVDETIRRYGEAKPEYEKIVREDLRAKEGMGAVAKRVIPKIEELIAAGETKIVADGLYSWAEYKLFKERWGEDAIIMAITAPRHVRHTRLAKRPVRPLTDEEVTAREYAEIENIEKGGPIANADYTLVNSGPPEDLIGQLDTVLSEANFV
jgi:dephospho-CoA kinase